MRSGSKLARTRVIPHRGNGATGTPERLSFWVCGGGSVPAFRVAALNAGHAARGHLAARCGRVAAACGIYPTVAKKPFCFSDFPLTATCLGPTLFMLERLGRSGAGEIPRGQGMIKSQLVARLTQRYPHLYHRDVERIVSTVLDAITNALAQGHRVELRGFGAFSVKSRPARTGRNPRTGEAVTVSEKRAPFFRTGKELRERLNMAPAERPREPMGTHIGT